MMYYECFAVVEFQSNWRDTESRRILQMQADWG